MRFTFSMTSSSTMTLVGCLRVMGGGTFGAVGQDGGFLALHGAVGNAGIRGPAGRAGPGGRQGGAADLIQAGPEGGLGGSVVGAEIFFAATGEQAGGQEGNGVSG